VELAGALTVADARAFRDRDRSRRVHQLQRFLEVATRRLAVDRRPARVPLHPDLPGAPVHLLLTRPPELLEALLKHRGALEETVGLVADEALVDVQEVDACRVAAEVAVRLISDPSGGLRDRTVDLDDGLEGEPRGREDEVLDCRARFDGEMRAQSLLEIAEL